MSDFKSKIPDFHEMATFTGKLIKDIKKSIGEIMVDYKHKRAEDAKNEVKTDVKKEDVVKSAKVEVEKTTVETIIVEESKDEPVKKVKQKVEEVVVVKSEDQEPKS